MLKRIKRNLIGSIGLGMLVYAITSMVNIALFGWFSQQGGLELIGLWTILLTIMSIVLLADYGFRDALTRSLVVEKHDKPLNIIFYLCYWIFMLGLSVTALVLVGSVHWATRPEPIWGGLLAAWGGILQVTSGWLISLRLGHHEQHWWYLKIFIRVLVQSALVPILILGSGLDIHIALGLALLLGGVSEAAITVLITRNDISSVSLKSVWAFSPRKVLTTTGGFGPVILMQRLQEPITRILLFRFGGIDLLGIFTVACKMPQTSSAAISEGMRPLLPGLSELSQAGDTNKAAELIGQSLLHQMVLNFPVSMFLWIYALPIFQVWLGFSDPTLVQISKTFIIGYAFINQTVPFFWCLQAYGYVSAIAWLTVLNIVIIVTVCVPALLFFEDALLVCVKGIVLSQIIFSILIHFICQLRCNLVCVSYSYVPWVRVILLNGCLLAYNLTINSVWGGKENPIFLLSLAVAGSTVLYAIFWIIIMLIRHQKENK
jgi:O-antigen/teichoic acid export membrane protein